MNINKKYDRFKHSLKERIGGGGENKTNNTEEFRSLETEMQLRHEGMDRLQRSMTVYVKSLSKRTEEEKEKPLALAYMGTTMSNHGDDFEPESEFGQCLQSFGRANERISRMQENYVSAATSSWLEGLERSMAQMKEYQTSRKKLESRRLAFDTSQAKMQKSKKDDFRTEEELRSARAKYEESSEDVYRRMLDIKEAEEDSVADLTAFLEAELGYYDRAREILIQLKREWPASTTSPASAAPRRGPRSRTNTTTSFRHIDEEDEPTPTIPIRSRIASASGSVQNSPMREKPGFDFPPTKPSMSRNNSTFEGPVMMHRDVSRESLTRLSRVPTETSIMSGRSQLRPVKSRDPNADVFGDENENGYGDYEDRSPSPSSVVSSAGRSLSASYPRQDSALGRKMAPPPPPSRSKKPPPPPPLKRSALSSSQVPYL